MKNFMFISLLTGLLIVSCNKSDNKQSSVNNTNATTIKYEVKISGMTCTGCEQTIQNSVTGINGVKTIVANHIEGNAIIEFDSVQTDTSVLKEKINQTGYVVVAFNPQAK